MANGIQHRRPVGRSITSSTHPGLLHVLLEEEKESRVRIDTFGPQRTSVRQYCPVATWKDLEAILNYLGARPALARRLDPSPVIFLTRVKKGCLVSGTRQSCTHPC